MNRAPAILAGLVCAVATLSGQQPTFRSSVDTVAIYATGPGRQRRLVPDLERKDFW
jgi:hypothetical protein